MSSPAATGGSQCCFCASVPPFSSALVRISGPRDQAARGGQRRRRQLLGDDDHRQVAHALAAVLLGHRHAEVAQLAHGAEDRLGHQVVVPVDVLRERRDLLAGEGARGVARHLGEVAVDVAVVGAAGADHLLTDVTEARLVLRGAHGAAHLGRARACVRARSSETPKSSRCASIAPAQLRRHLAREGCRHRVRGLVGRARLAPGRGVGGEGLGRAHLGGGVRQPLGVDLMIVDRLAALRDAGGRSRARCP